MPDDNNKKNLNSAVEAKNNIENLPERQREGLESFPEIPAVPEAGKENVRNHEKSSADRERASQNLEAIREAVPDAGQSIDAKQARQARQKKIEKVLEADLGDIYLSLPPLKQNEFKIAGEQTAEKINMLLEAGKAKAGKIIELIKKWLQLIPGINRFFLEQEAKIKADEIMKLKAKDN